MGEMIADIKAVRWDQLTDAYGSAEGIGKALIVATEVDSEESLGAWDILREALCPQGSMLAPAALQATPFILRILESQNGPGPGFRLVGDIARVFPKINVDNAAIGPKQYERLVADVWATLHKKLDLLFNLSQAVLDEHKPLALYALSGVLATTGTERLKYLEHFQRLMRTSVSPQIRIAAAFGMTDFSREMASSSILAALMREGHVGVRTGLALAVSPFAPNNRTIAKYLMEALTSQEDYSSVLGEMPWLAEGLKAEVIRALSSNISIADDVSIALIEHLRSVSGYCAYSQVRPILMRFLSNPNSDIYVPQALKALADNERFWGESSNGEVMLKALGLPSSRTEILREHS